MLGKVEEKRRREEEGGYEFGFVYDDDFMYGIWVALWKGKEGKEER